MKILPTAMLLLLVGLAGAAGAQHHRVSLGYGYATREQFLNGAFSVYKNYSAGVDGSVHTAITREVLATDERVFFNDRRRSGGFSLQYDYLPGRYLAFGVSAIFEQEACELGTRNSNNMGNQPIGNYRRRAFTLAPEVNIAYTKPGVARVYGLVGMGVTFAGETITGPGGRRSFSGNYYAFQLSPFCMRFGHTVSGWFELGYGYKGVVSVGAAYRF